MKKILFILTVFAIISCENKNDVIKNNISEKLKSEFKNPDSFEFVSMKVLTTISVKERKLIVTEEMLHKVRELNTKTSNDALLKQVETEYNFLNKQGDDSKDALYNIEFIAKGTNSFGATIQNRYSVDVLNNDEFTILKVSSLK